MFQSRYLIVLFVLLAGLIVGFFIGTGNAGQKSQSNVSENCTYTYINPLRCLENGTKQTGEYTAFRKKLQQKIDEWAQSGVVENVSIQFRDLENGPTMSINVQEEFAPASLLKVPLLMAVYRKSEKEPDFLKNKITVNVNLIDDNQAIEPEKSVEKGKTYSIDDLLYKMIVNSDNKSTVLLRQQLRETETDQEWYITTLSDLGIKDFTLDSTDDDFITVKNYASLFRILYNASYLNRDDSEKALSLLSKVEFDDGIVAGVPKDVQVAHKFGVRDFPNESLNQLHDCGIVYYPKNHYLLCIMTRGDKVVDLVKVIQEISTQVFQEVKSRS